MTSFQVTRTFVFDPTEYAVMIEMLAAPYLKEVEHRVGVFVKGTDIQLALTPLVKISNRTDNGPIPLRGISIIQAYIGKLLNDNAKYSKNKHSLQDIWSHYLLEEYIYTNEVYELIENILIDLRTNMREFIGDNKWIMYFQKNKGYDILIEASGDYRVHAWMEEHEHEYK